MKGDFSKWKHDPENNFNGVLHQQGRVLLDSDWNAQTQITNGWQDTAARDAFGPGVAAVPAEERDSFRVTGAKVSDGKVEVTLLPGRVWADGLLVRLEDKGELTASYLKPIPEGADNSKGARDAVVLEVWREEINGFQMPDELIEPALGGPDTTERVHTAFALKLLRLEPGQACENIGNALEDNFAQKGTLTVTLQPPDKTDESCPKVESGGYTGFEHCLYRIEIAQVDEGKPPMFKYSRFNGGLVGRGNCVQEGADLKKIIITGNNQAITSLDMDSSFYLEVIEKDFDQGFWRVVYGAEVTLGEDNLNVGKLYYNSKNPSGIQFFRLWDGIREIGDFKEKDPHELCDGICLQFRDPLVIEYTPEDDWWPGDYWTFPVRAGEMGNASTLIDARPPEGVHYHRAPLAVLHWSGGNLSSIMDCRRVFQPLIDQKVCCSYTVGDGTSSHGDYDSIEEAISRLPSWGGEICLLPGVHHANVCIEDRFNIRIKGCGLRTIVAPRKDTPDQPIFRIVRSWHIAIEHLWPATVTPRTAVAVEGGGWIEICHNYIFALSHAIHIQGGSHFNIHHNAIRMLDVPEGRAAIYFKAQEGLIERNDIAVFPAVQTPHDVETTQDRKAFEQNTLAYTAFLGRVAQFDLSAVAVFPVLEASGGIQIGSGSEKVSIKENRILGGRENGITLGSSLDAEKLVGEIVPGRKVNQITLPEPGEIAGKLVTEGEAVDKPAAILFEKEGGEITPANIREDGSFEAKLTEPGNYRVKSSNPSYQIMGIAINAGRRLYQEYTINGVQAEPSAHLLDIFAFTSEVSILGNEILNMGLSGIGTPQKNFIKVYELLSEDAKALSEYPLVTFLANSFAVVSGWIADLSIQGNHISNCLREAVDSRVLQHRGEGGISLGMCENLTIQQNRIDGNGQHHADPVCGIFVSYAAQADISHNHIINNGPLDPQTGRQLNQGIRGGVVLRLTAPLVIAGALESVRALLQSETDNAAAATTLTSSIAISAVTGGYAARIHDNQIKQPVGQALAMQALGAISVANNLFQVDFSDGNKSPNLRWIDELAGAVLIVGLESFAAANAVSAQPSPGLFNGPAIFSNNQTRLLYLDAISIGSQLICATDDLSFANNQSEVYIVSKNSNNSNISTNTTLSASTLRASYSRFMEFCEGNPFSLLTHADIMNNTSNNQGNNCIYAVPVDNSLIRFSGNNSKTACKDKKGYQAKATAIKEYIDGKINEVCLDGLNDVDKMTLLYQELLQHEVKQLEQKLGKDNPRLKQLKVRARDNLGIRQDLEIGLETAKIRVQKVPKSVALVHGRITDRAKRGIFGLIVIVEDENEKRLIELGGETNASGYYAIQFSPEMLKKLEESKVKVHLAVAAKTGTAIHREKKPIALEPGKPLIVNITLDRSTFVQ
jgi:hypothetical protein